MVTKTSHLPIRYFLALLWAHPILHISTIRVNVVENNKSSKPKQENQYREANICSIGKVKYYISYKPRIIHRVNKRAPLGPTGPN